MKYKVIFGMARAYTSSESHENTRYKYFSNKKKAEKYLQRLHKFSFKDNYFPEFSLIAWTDFIYVKEEIEEAQIYDDIKQQITNGGLTNDTTFI